MSDGTAGPHVSGIVAPRARSRTCMCAVTACGWITNSTQGGEHDRRRQHDNGIKVFHLDYFSAVCGARAHALKMCCER